MKQTNDFLTPDYFPQFRCKIGDCRTACCQGWPVSVSMQNYFNLLGMDCPPDLRSRLDVGLRMVDHPTPQEYARFNPRWNGDCPMRLEDGRCSLHAELGEDILPDICRLYPRGIRSGAPHELPECSCANSCEATLEMFLHRTEPLRFVTNRLTMDVPDAAKRASYFPNMNREQEIRLFFIRLMQDRTLSLRERMIRLGYTVSAMAKALNAGDADAVQALLDGNLPEYTAAEEISVDFPLEIAANFAELLDRRSDSIRELGEAALAALGSGDDAALRCRAAKEHFDAMFPDWEVFFEHTLVNHLFFTRFPFQDRPVSLSDEFVALCAVYLLIRFLCLGCVGAADNTDEITLIDTVAAAFRLIQHSDFDRLAAHTLRQLNCTAPAQLHALLAL